MQKIAAPDPRFKALKQHKKNWNLAAKELIARLIAFKKALNGNASTKYSLPPSKLHQPVPQELINFINTLSSNYESVAEEALKIIREQNEFAAGKVQSMPTELPKAASLKIEASSKLSRFWAYLKSPFLSEENKKIRVSLLSSLASLEDMFKEFEGMILSKDEKSIVQALKELIKIENRFNIISNTFANLLQTEEKPGITDSSSTGAGIDDTINKAQESINDMVFASNIPGAETHRQGTAFDNLVIDFKREQDAANKQNIAKQIISIHERLLGMANQLHKQNAPSFEKLFEFVKRKASSNNELIAEGSNFITRWLKKKRHQAKFYDEISASRIQIQEISVELRDSLDELMNSLEKDLDIEEVKNSLKKIMSGITFIKFLMKPLQAIVKGQALDRALDPAAIEHFFGKETPEKKKERLQRKYNTEVDRQILNTLFK